MIIPKQLRQFYSKSGFRPNLYIRLRWLCCPFEKIEKYLPKSGIIFDIGCGYGLLANYLSFVFPQRKVIGVDLAPGRIAIAQKSVGQRENIEFFCEDISNLNLESCDGAVMTDFLHHLHPDISQELFNILYQKLTASGVLVIQEVNRTPFWKYLFTLSIDRLLNIGKPLYYKSVGEWKEILEKTGFRVKIIPADKGLFFADVLLICQKNE